MKLKIVFSLLVTALLFSACDKSMDGLTSDEKKLVKDLIAKMKNDPVHIQDVGFTESNSKAFYYYDKLFSLESYFDPIDSTAARRLQKNYFLKKTIIEGSLPNDLRASSGKPEDTKSIWIPSDSLKKFVGALYKYEADTREMTGVQIVLGSYRYDKGKDGEMKPSGERKNQDSVSGRTTVFFIATRDTVPGTKTTYVSRHKAITTSPSIYSGLKIINHGALCPDSCVNTGF